MKISIVMITIKKYETIKERIKEALDAALLDNQFILIENENGGVAENRNKGMCQAENDYIIFIDDDLYEYPKGWDKMLIEKVDKNTIVGPRLLNMDGGIQDTISKCNNLEENYINVDYIPGACMALKKNNIYFDEGYKKWGCEDPDFILEQKKYNKNYKVLLCNDVKIKHMNEMKNMKMYDIENKNRFAKKWGFLIQ